ncbi:MAG: PEP-CTERM sorting domain-containing protein [Planctomycetota bacterium]
MVDQVLIDTIAIPEPATLGILTIGTVWLVRRQRK